MSYDEDDEESKQSIFNAGVAKAERIDSLQRALNAARFNPKAFNYETGTYNFEVMKNSIDSLHMEARAKGTKIEREYLARIKNSFDKILKLYPAYAMSVNIDGENEFEWNDSNLELINKFITRYEEVIRDVLEAHALDAPNKDYDDDYI